MRIGFLVDPRDAGIDGAFAAREGDIRMVLGMWQDEVRKMAARACAGWGGSAPAAATGDVEDDAVVPRIAVMSVEMPLRW